jgi:hypothetical protein
VSKLINHVSKLQEEIQKQNYRDCNELVENLMSIGAKFYELYPSNDIIKNLKVRREKKEF